MSARHLTRRRIVFASAGLGLGTAGLAFGTDRARASVDGQFTISDRTFQPEDNALAQLWATASGTWSFAALPADPEEWRCYLLVDHPDGTGQWQALGTDRGDVTTRKASGTYALRGEITSASHYDAAQFDVSDGEPMSVRVPLAVLFLVRGGGETLAESRLETAVTVTVEPGGTVSSLGGEGAVAAVDDAGDPTPTLPGGA